MPRLDAPLDPVTVASLKGTLDYYLWRGVPVIRSWPRKPAMPRSPAVTQTYTEFGEVARLLSAIPAEFQQAANDATINTNWTWRDVWTAGLYGNLFRSAEPEPETEVPLMPPFISGRYYGPPGLSVDWGSVTYLTGTMRLAPFFVPELTLFDRIAWEVLSGTGTNDRLAIYGPLESDYTLAPLLLDTGNVAIGTTGAKEVTISVTLASGWYLLGLQNGTSRNYIGLSSNSSTPAFGQASAGNVRPTSLITKTVAFGAFPNPLGATLLFPTAIATPGITLRKA